MHFRTMRFRAHLLTVVAAAVAATLPLGAASYTIDGIHSSAMFKVKHLGTSNFYGAFNEVTGTINYDPAQPEAGSITLTIPTASVGSRNTQRDDHLKSPDFFNAKQFPNITFKSTSVKKTGEHTYDVTGELDLHGTRKPIPAKVEHTGAGTHPRSQKPIVGFETRLVLKRSDFGMNYMVGPLGDDIEILVAIEAAVP